MTTRPALSLRELEQVRLLLRGGSVVDWFRLRHEASDDVAAFLRLNGADADDPVDRARIAELRDTAAAYLFEEHGYRVPPDLVSCDPLELFMYASEKRGRRRHRFFACLLLKVMHIVNHIDSRELRFRFPLSQSGLAQLLVDRVEAFAKGLRAEGFPIVKYLGGEKTRSSLITKLLVKKETHAATIHDRVRFRFVVNRPLDTVALLVEMTRRLFPYNYIVPGETVNLLVNFTALMESRTEYRTLSDALQVELGHEDHAPRLLNEFSSSSFRVINFVVDIPLRMPDELLAQVPDRQGLGRVIFGLAEFQVVDAETDTENARGDSTHERYRARQLHKVRDRLERGMRGFRDDEP